MSLPMIQNKTWYSNGLRFKCTGCGQCCTGAPGYVWINLDEVQEIANYLKISIHDFAEKYLREINGRFSLKEDPVNYDCVFLKDNKCSVYQHRPKQCRTYPWWISNLRSKKDWNEAASMCEGINHKDAPLIPFEFIESERDDAV